MPLSHLKSDTRFLFNRSASRLLVVAVAVASVLTLGVANASRADAADAPAANGELVVNGDFAAGVQNWRTNAPDDTLSASTTVVRTGKNSARIDAGASGVVVLNDQKNTVASTTAGTPYTMTAWVKVSRPGVIAEIKAREVGPTQTFAHKTGVKTTGTEWLKLSMSFTAKWSKSALDLNITFLGAQKSQQVYIDSVSLTHGTGSSTVQPPASGDAPAQGECSQLPLGGTKFGVALDINQSQNFGAAYDSAVRAYGTPEMIRVFNPGAPSNWNAAATAKGADLSVSFKIAPRDVLSGANDSKLRAWFRAAPKNVHIYWTYFHEPEDDIERGAFTAKDYRAAWQRIVSISREVCQPNLHPTLILMGWTVDPLSGRKFTDYYPGSSYIDVLAWDPYNPWPPQNTGYRSPAAIFGGIVSTSKAQGKAFAIAETGSILMGTDTGAKRAAWLSDTAKYLEDQNALFVSYFDTVDAGRGFDFRLRDSASKAAWRTAIQG